MPFPNKIVYLILGCFAFLLIYCNNKTELNISDAGSFLNLQDSVQYMGMETCRSCHAEIYDSFIETGMGQSFDIASPEKSSAHFDNHLAVYHEETDFYYKPFFENNEFYIQEYRLENGDTTHLRKEKIKYIIGSGQHTNSHIVDVNGYLFQAPITYYTQKKKWDLAPGFDQTNLRFTRTLNDECITCHNHLPGFVEGSHNRFTEMPTGIQCERCHGPGEIHVKEMLKGNRVDTATQIDYSIVNPRHLDKDLQMDLCQRCHLQGIAVLEEGKTFFDFKPGMALSDVFNVFLPRYTNSHEKFIMASQADRFRLSKCYIQSEDFTCISCHHPHVSVKKTGVDRFNTPCQQCHQNDQQVKCTASEPMRLAENNNCVKCHMPPSGSIDIPHVRITDHFISKGTAIGRVQKDTVDREAIARFLGLKILTKSVASPLEMAQGYIALYDKYTPEPAVLDSAWFHLSRSTASLDKTFKTKIHYHFAKEEFEAIVKLANQFSISKIKDDWTAYRIGEAFNKVGDVKATIPYYEKACASGKFNLEFQEKLGTAYLKTKQIKKAKTCFNFILSENPKRKMALCNLGYCYALTGNVHSAMEYYDKALALDPDYVQALLNKIALLMLKNELIEGKQLLKRILKIEPNNQNALSLLQRLNG